MYEHREHRRTVSVFDRSDVYDDHREHRIRYLSMYVSVEAPYGLSLGVRYSLSRDVRTS